MSKNHKEQSAYAYQHDTGRLITRKMLYRLKRKWWRHNFNIGEMRFRKKQLKVIINRD